MGDVAKRYLSSVVRLTIFSGEEFDLIITSSPVRADGPAIDCRHYQQDKVYHFREM